MRSPQIYYLHWCCCYEHNGELFKYYLDDEDVAPGLFRTRHEDGDEIYVVKAWYFIREAEL